MKVSLSTRVSLTWHIQTTITGCGYIGVANGTSMSTRRMPRSLKPWTNCLSLPKLWKNAVWRLGRVAGGRVRHTREVIPMVLMVINCSMLRMWIPILSCGAINRNWWPHSIYIMTIRSINTINTRTAWCPLISLGERLLIRMQRMWNWISFRHGLIIRMKAWDSVSFWNVAKWTAP